MSTKAEVQLSSRAQRDLRRIGPGPERERIIAALRRLAAGRANLDVKALEGQAQWLRMRVGDYRVLYRPAESGFWVERIVNRSDLQRSVASL